jgi:16S rRNA (adenine(1408)-N(1))-methyltransferase
VKILSGKKQYDIDVSQIYTQFGGYTAIHVDVGTGSGKFILKSALRNHETFYIGIDSCAENMHKSAIRVAKTAKKRQGENVMFVVSAIESLSKDFFGIADSVSVILPWGSLRDGIAKGEVGIIGNLRALGKSGSTLQIIIGYDKDREPHIIHTNALPLLSANHFESLKPLYHEYGISILNVTTLDNSDLKQINSDWAKRLAYGTKREIYRLDCTYI